MTESHTPGFDSLMRVGVFRNNTAAEFFRCECNYLQLTLIDFKRILAGEEIDQIDEALLVLRKRLTRKRKWTASSFPSSRLYFLLYIGDNVSMNKSVNERRRISSKRLDGKKSTDINRPTVSAGSCSQHLSGSFRIFQILSASMKSWIDIHATAIPASKWIDSKNPPPLQWFPIQFQPLILIDESAPFGC